MSKKISQARLKDDLSGFENGHPMLGNEDVQKESKLFLNRPIKIEFSTAGLDSVGLFSIFSKSFLLWESERIFKDKIDMIS